MVGLMKIEDPFSPPGDQPDLNKLRRTKQPLSVLGRKPVLCPFLQPGLLLPGGERGSPQRSRLGGHRFLPLGPTHVAPYLRPGYWCCRLGEREMEPGLEGSELPPGACRAWGSSCGPARLGSPVPDSSLLSSFWVLCCSGHSKWTQWNTSFAVLCVPTIRMKEAGCLSKVTDCQDLQETLVLSATMVHCCWLVETST